jgi:hypothetical protein
MNWINGYYRNDGTYVEGHYRTSPNNYTWDNLYSDGVDMDGDGYGAGTPNSLYDWDSNGIYDGFYNYGSYNTYDWNSYDYNWNNYNTYDTYDYDWNSYDNYDTYDYDWNSYDSYDWGW